MFLEINKANHSFVGSVLLLELSVGRCSNNVLNVSISLNKSLLGHANVWSDMLQGGILNLLNRTVHWLQSQSETMRLV